MQGRLTISSETGFGSQFCADLPLPAHTRAIAPAPLKGKVIAITAASSGLAELLKGLLPLWGLEYQQRSIEDSLLGLEPDVLITDARNACSACALRSRRRSCW